jgi:hypothetical protein
VRRLPGFLTHSRELVAALVAVLAVMAWVAPAAFAVPPNDDFASAQAISGIDVAATESNADATKETGEPDHAGNVGGRSLWYQWTAVYTGMVVIDTCGSDFDTLLAVYTGNSVSGLTPVTSNDDACNILQSRVKFQATKGVAYQIAVDGFRSPPQEAALGSVSLSLRERPLNDDFEDAQVISGSTATVEGTNAGATSQADDPKAAGERAGASVWYSWTAPASGLVHLDTCTADFNELLRVFAGSTLTSLTEVARNGFGGCGNQSRLVFRATAGTAYAISIEGTGCAPAGCPDPPTGHFDLVLKPAEPPANDDFANAEPLSGASTSASGSNVDATFQSGEVPPSFEGTTHSVWYRWQAPHGGNVMVDPCISHYIPRFRAFTGATLGTLTAAPSGATPTAPGASSTCVFLQSFTATAGSIYRISADLDDDYMGHVAFKLDLSPETSIANLRVRGRNVVARFKATDPWATFKCRIDKKPYTACASSKAFKHLTAGKHQVSVVATDLWPNSDPTPAVKSFRIR